MRLTMKLFNTYTPNLPDEVKDFLDANEELESTIEIQVRSMLKELKSNGFTSLQNYTKTLDDFELTKTNMKVSKQEIHELAQKIKPELASNLDLAVERISFFHKQQIEKGFQVTDNEGNMMGQKIVPLDSVGVYVPGGRALYPSTFYMTVVPALIAGVKRIVVISPPRTFVESPEIAYLLEKFNIEEVYRGSGAALVLASAYGLCGIEKVSKIVGPGNAYIAKAKQICYGKISIDMIAGPSDICVVTDSVDTNDIVPIASDLLSQAEHDPLARPVLICTNEDFALKVKQEVYAQANALPINKENALASLNNQGLIIVTNNIETAIALANDLAPEHLELFVDNASDYLPQIKFAGSVFLGKYTPESVGDYLGGPNHVLPTSSTAKFFSPLGVYDYTTKFSYLEFTKEKFRTI